MNNDKKSLIDFTLRKLTSITKDMEDIKVAKCDCEQNSEFDSSYALEYANGSLRKAKRNLWSALGEACDFDLKNIVDVMEQIAREGKYVED